MRYVILSAPSRKNILSLSIDSIRRFEIPEPVVIMGNDFTDETEDERVSIVTEAHKHQWRIAADSDEPVCIFEDDAQFLRKCAVPDLQDGELFFFGVTNAWLSSYINCGLSILSKMRGVHAYIVTPFAARILLDVTACSVVDHITNNPIQTGLLRGIVPTPYACCQMPHKSNISPHRSGFKIRHSAKFGRKTICCEEMLGIESVDVLIEGRLTNFTWEP